MAWLDAITKNTNLLAGAVSDLMDSRAARLGLKQCPLIATVLGSKFGTDAVKSPSFKGMIERKISGDMGGILVRKDPGSFTGIALANAVDAVTPAMELDRFGNPEFKHAMYKKQEWLPLRELDTLKGENSRINYIEQVTERIVDAAFATIATDFNATGDQTETTIGSWRRAIGINDSEIGTYLGMQRAQTGNASFRANVLANSGSGAAISIERVRSGLLQCGARRGNPDLIVAGVANYGALQNDVQEYQHVIVGNAFMGQFGFRTFLLDGVPVVLDSYCNADWVGIFDTSTWKVWFSEDGFNIGVGSPYAGVEAAVPVMSRFYMSVVCDNPGHNAKIYTGSSYIAALSSATG